MKEKKTNKKISKDDDLEKQFDDITDVQTSCNIVYFVCDCTGICRISSILSMATVFGLLSCSAATLLFSNQPSLYLSTVPQTFSQHWCSGAKPSREVKRFSRYASFSSSNYASFSSSSNEPSRQYTRTPGGAPITARDRYTISASQNRHHTRVSPESNDTVGYRGVLREMMSVTESSAWAGNLLCCPLTFHRKWMRPAVSAWDELLHVVRFAVE